MPTTPNHHLPYPALDGSDAVDVPGDLHDLALAVDGAIVAPPSDAAAGTPSLRSLGTTATQAAPGNDSRFTDPVAMGARKALIVATDLVNVSSRAFSGLNGDVDRQYKLGYSGVLALGGADRQITVIPNASGAFFNNIIRQTWWDSGMHDSSFEARANGLGFLCGLGSYFGGGGAYGANHVTGEIQIEARRISGLPRMSRAAFGWSPDAATERHLMADASGKWEDMATNITSLAINFGGGTFTGDIWLERVFT